MCSFRVNFFFSYSDLAVAVKGCPVSSSRGAQVLPSHPRLSCGFTSRLLTCAVLVTLLTEEQTMCVCVALRIKKEKNINTSTQWQQSRDHKANAVPAVGLLESSVFFKLLRRIFTAPSHLWGARRSCAWSHIETS